MRVVFAIFLGVLIAGVASAGTSIDISNSAITANAPEQMTMHNVALPGLGGRYWATFEWDGEKGIWEMAKAGEQVPGMVFFGADCYQQGDVFTAAGTIGNPVDAEGDSDERPARRVCLFSFYLDENEVTQAQYRAVMGDNPAFFSGNPNDEWRMPVEHVTWDQARQYCESMKKRLPTESEWEYAARSGGLEQRWAGTNEISAVGTYGWTYENSEFRSRFLRQKSPNGAGLFDMTGNVWEWVADWYDPEYYSERPYWNPKGPSDGSLRVIRGGGWNQLASEARTTQRLGMDPGDSSSAVGFRCAMDPMITKTECMDCTCADYVASHPTDCAGANTLEFRISWDDTNDVDLHVLYDDGSGTTDTIYWNNRQGSSGGNLDADWNAACVNLVANQVTERVSYVNPPAGTYTLRVCGFEQCRSNNSESSVTTQILTNGAISQSHTLTVPRWDQTGACTDVFTHTVN